MLVGLYSLKLQPFDRLRESGGLFGLLVFDQGKGLDVGRGHEQLVGHPDEVVPEVLEFVPPALETLVDEVAEAPALADPIEVEGGDLGHAREEVYLYEVDQDHAPSVEEGLDREEGVVGEGEGEVGVVQAVVEVLEDGEDPVPE